MAKKKPAKQKKIKQEKAKREALRQLPEEEARELVEELIGQGKPREAIQTIQQFPFGDKPGFVFLKALAYAHRSRQLLEKGMEQESATVLDLLRTQLSRLGNLDCDRMGRIVAAAPLSFALACYRKHGESHPFCPFLEKALGDQMVLENRWEIIDGLPEESPLKRDGAMMAEAARDMAAALWEEALSKLGPLSRKSPFASWKLFAKAMASAYNGEEEDLQRALKQLPEDFPLGSTVSVLREKGCKGLDEVHERVCGADQTLAAAVVKAIKAEDKETARLLPQLAKSLYPDHPALALQSLAETTACALFKKEMELNRIRKFLPADISRTLLVRLEMFLATQSKYDLEPFCPALRYLESLDDEFAHVRDKKRMEAAVYYLILRELIAIKCSPRMLRPRERSCLRTWLGDGEVETEDLFVALVDKITRLAPDVELYYRVLEGIIVSELSSQGEDLLESVLLRVTRDFPEDPFPYLELAKLYWQSNAYRKSQQILEKAWEKAPYDPKVREYYGLGLLRAAVRSRNRKAFEVARKDLEKARDLNLKDLAPLAHAVEATLNYLETGEQSQALDPLLAVRSVVVRLRSLVYLWADLGRVKEPGAEDFAYEVRDAVRKELKSALDQISGRDLLDVIAPFPPELEYLLGDFDGVTFFGDAWPGILAVLNDQQVLNAYARLLGRGDDYGQFSSVGKDLDARLEREGSNVFLRFYSVLLGYLEGSAEGPEVFEDLLDELDEEEKRKLSDYCRAIASSFPEPLADALESFDFDLLYEDFEDDEDDEDEDYDDEDDWPPDMGALFDDEDEFEDEGLSSLEDPVGAMLEVLRQARGNKEVLLFMFEALVEEFGSSGAGDEVLRYIGLELEVRGKDVLESLRQLYRGKGAKTPSRAVRLVLFPERA